MASSEKDPVVIDNGSYHIRAGFGGDDAPRMCEPSLIGVKYHSRALRICQGSPFNKDGHIINWNNMVCSIYLMYNIIICT